MELFRTAANPWGQDVLVGIAWGLMWVALILDGSWGAPDRHGPRRLRALRA